MKKIKFIKMHGLGNDYIYIDTDKYPIEDPASFAITWSKYHTGIGSDGLVLISLDKRMELYRMRIFNADGSEAMMCGNAIRCVGKLLYERGYVYNQEMDILTLSGTKHLSLQVQEGKVLSATVDMGTPKILREQTSVTLEEETLQGIGVSMGNPHWITFLESSPQEALLSTIGPKVETHPLFPDRTNFEMAYIKTPHLIEMRVWERGSGITMACGTGACATAVAAIQKGIANSPITVSMPGGSLTIEWDGEETSPVWMTGEAAFVFEGEIFV